MSFKCNICGKEDNSMLKANHRDLGAIKLCLDCWTAEKDKNKLNHLNRGCSCCR